MGFDGGRLADTIRIDEGVQLTDSLTWRCRTDIVDTYLVDHGAYKAGARVTQTVFGNVLVNGGADLLWERLITPKPSTSSTGAVAQAYSTKAAIGAGASTATAAASQTDLQHSSNKVYVVMTTGYPTHTTGTSTAARSAVFRATFGTSQANFTWNEWGLFNSTGANKRMLNRKVQSLGAKTTAATRQITVTLTLS